jgi:hypothetical protein
MTLDPTEKGAISYFLGMTVCKLFAAKKLKTPWLLHLDVWRPWLDAVLKDRSRPDLVGKPIGSSRWHGFECKGRVSMPNDTVKSSAKLQAARLESVEGQPCDLHVGAVTYFRGDVLQFYWCDPPARRMQSAIAVPKIQTDLWSHYYGPVMHLVERAPRRSTSAGLAGELYPIEEADLQIGIHPTIADSLHRREWRAAQSEAEAGAELLAKDGYQPDGLVVRVGQSWQQPFRG